MKKDIAHKPQLPPAFSDMKAALDATRERVRAVAARPDLDPMMVPFVESLLDDLDTFEATLATQAAGLQRSLDLIARYLTDRREP